MSPGKIFSNFCSKCIQICDSPLYRSIIQTVSYLKNFIHICFLLFSAFSFPVSIDIVFSYISRLAILRASYLFKRVVRNYCVRELKCKIFIIMAIFILLLLMERMNMVSEMNKKMMMIIIMMMIMKKMKMIISAFILTKFAFYR